MNLEVGSILTGKVTGLAKFGAFVSLAPDVSGLVHISEVANTYINNVEEHLSVGQEVKVKVIAIDANNRINLSIKQAQDNWRPAPRRVDRQPRNDSARPRPAAPAEQRDRRRPPDAAGGIPRAEPIQKSENAAFEDTLKKFMQESDSKISESGRYEKQRSTRRKNGRHS